MANSQIAYSLLLGALSGDDDLPVTLCDGKIITRAQWRLDVACVATKLKQLPEGDIALYEIDCYLFCVWLFTAWHVGRCVVSPSDNTLPTTRKMIQLTAALVGAFSNANLTNWQDIDPTQLYELYGQMHAIDVFTSGSTGEPKRISKKLIQLNDEVYAQERVFGDNIPKNACIFASVSQQHSYGFLFRAVWTLISSRCFSANIWIYTEDIYCRDPFKTMVIIGSPAFLKRLAENFYFSILSHECCAIFSSGGPLPNIEISAQEDGLLQVSSSHLSSFENFVCSDYIQLENNSSFHLLGRSDRIVKIEEKRISLVALELALLDTGLIKEANVVVLYGVRTELGAAAVLTDTAKELLFTIGKVKLIRLLSNDLAQSFELVSLPRSWRFVLEIPKNTTGKITNLSSKALFEKGFAPDVIDTKKRRRGRNNYAKYRS